MTGPPDTSPLHFQKIDLLASPDEAVHIIKQDGVLKVQGFLDHEVVQRFQSEIDEAVTRFPAGPNADADIYQRLIGPKTKQVANLVETSKTFRHDVLNHKWMHSVLETMFRAEFGDYWMNRGSVLHLEPGEKAQGIHKDDRLYRVSKFRRPDDPELMVNIIVALTEFREDNGATVVVPGSHLWDTARPRPSPEEAIPMLLQPGDAMIFVGGLFHGAGENRSAGNRRGMFISMHPGCFTPMESHHHVPRAIIDSMTPLAQKMIGWRSLATHHRIPLLRAGDERMEDVMGLPTTTSPKAVTFIQSHRNDPYQAKVVKTYEVPGEQWEKALGNEGLGFQFGSFDQAELAAGPKPGPVGLSELRYFDRQLEIAGLWGPNQPPLNRIMDLGCGWGSITEHLAKRFPQCPCIDGINISQTQLDYFVDRLPADLSDRINLYNCNGQDVDLLPDPATAYDLVVVRGVYTHFLNQTFEDSVARVVPRLAPGGVLLISDALYRTDNLAKYESHIPDTRDRVAVGNRKTVGYYTSVLIRNGLVLQDFRLLPSAAEVIHWFKVVQLNIEQNFPEDGVPGPISELYELARNGADAVAKNKLGIYSIVARRAVS